MIGTGCTVRIEYSSKLIRKFQAAARAAYPRETFAYLLGHALGDLYVIEDIWIPPDVGNHTTRVAVFIQDSWLTDAAEFAKEEELSVIGDIHSHPRPFKVWRGQLSEVTPSAGDHATGWGNGICGICVVTELKSGKLRTRVKFYPPVYRVEEIKR